LRLVGLAEELWQQEHAQPQARDEKARVEWLQAAMSRYRRLLDREPARIKAFRHQLEEYDQEQRRAGLGPAAPDRSYETPAAAIKECLLLLLGSPLALAGIAAHAIPYRFTAWVVKKLDRTAEEEATDKIAAGFFFYPLAWAVEAWVVHRMGGGWATAAFLAALLPTGFFALAWRERLHRFKREARAFVAFMKDKDLPHRLRERQRRLVTELNELSRLTAERGHP
jgi:Flp pilus assembly protein TadB